MAGQSPYAHRYVSGVPKLHLEICSVDRMGRTRSQQPFHGGMFCLWFWCWGGWKMKCVCVYVCSSKDFCCQVSTVPICSSHRASWTRSAINQTSATAEQESVVSSLVAQFSKKSRPPVTLLKGYNCRVAIKSTQKTILILWPTGHIERCSIPWLF